MWSMAEFKKLRKEIMLILLSQIKNEMPPAKITQ